MNIDKDFRKSSEYVSHKMDDKEFVYVTYSHVDPIEGLQKKDTTIKLVEAILEKDNLIGFSFHTKSGISYTVHEIRERKADSLNQKPEHLGEKDD